MLEPVNHKNKLNILLDGFTQAIKISKEGVSFMYLISNSLYLVLLY